MNEETCKLPVFSPFNRSKKNRERARDQEWLMGSITIPTGNSPYVLLEAPPFSSAHNLHSVQSSLSQILNRYRNIILSSACKLCWLFQSLAAFKGDSVPTAISYYLLRGAITIPAPLAALSRGPSSARARKPSTVPSIHQRAHTGW